MKNFSFEFLTHRHYREDIKPKLIMILSSGIYQLQISSIRRLPEKGVSSDFPHYGSSPI